jgi:hypothetical protein
MASRQPLWRINSADAPHRVDQHRRVEGEGRLGRECETVAITAGNGSYVYVTRSVDQFRILGELAIGVWVKATRSDLQILARVVLPSALDPQTRKPLSALVRGTSYKQVGAWEHLEISGFPQLVERQIRVLRAQYGSQIDSRGAYIDLVAVNIYGGQGQTQVWLDELDLSGAVPADAVPEATSNERTAVAGDANSQRAQSIRLSGSILNIDGRPILPRVIEHQGEPLKFLAELGFNAIRTSSTPTRELLSEAEQAGMWIVAPPPTLQTWQGNDGVSQVEPIPAAYDRVLAWGLGQDLAAPNLERIAQAAKQIRTADRRGARPVLCSPETALYAYSREVNILSAYRFPLSTSLQLTDYGTWLRERPRLARPGTPFWTVIQTQPASSMREQWAALAGTQVTGDVDSDALRLLVYTAIGAGMRGLEFASHSRLDAGDDETRLRALTLATINAELDLVEPWAAAGNYLTAADSNDPHVKGVVLQYERSRLLIVTRAAAHTQYLPQHASMQSVSFVLPGVPESHDFIELTAGGLRPLKHKRVTGGTLITLDDFDTTALVLMSPDPLITSVLLRRLDGIAKRTAEHQRDLVALTYAQVEAVERRLPAEVRDPSASAPLLQRARRSLDETQRALAAGDRRAAFLAARGANTPLGQLQRKHWERAAESLRSAVASPFVASFSTLPEHWQLIEKLRGSVRQASRLPAGDFEDLQAMIDAGWRHFLHPQEGIETAVEVSPGGTSKGRSSLRMEVQPKDRDRAATLVETAPLWVTSPPVRLARGDIVRIEGRVRVPTAIRGSVDGLMIVDSLGGESLAERFGQTNGWEEFLFYRAAPRDCELTLTFALTGFGEAMIDDVMIQPMGPAVAGPAASAARPPRIGLEQAQRMQQIFSMPRR